MKNIKKMKKKIGILGCGIMGSILLQILYENNRDFDILVFDNDNA